MMMNNYFQIQPNTISQIESVTKKKKIDSDLGSLFEEFQFKKKPK